MTQENVFLLHALWTGVLIALVYDGITVLRKTVAHNSFWTAMEDMGFWIFCATYVFAWLYRESNGTLRWYAVAGALAGMWVYKKNLSEILMKAATVVLGRMLKILLKILMVFTAPIRIFRRKTAYLHGRMQKQRRKIMGKCKFKLKSFAKALKIRLCKQ